MAYTLSPPLGSGALRTGSRSLLLRSFVSGQSPEDQGLKLMVTMVRTVRRSSTVASTVEGSYW